MSASPTATTAPSLTSPTFPSFLTHSSLSTTIQVLEYFQHPDNVSLLFKGFNVPGENGLTQRKSKRKFPAEPPRHNEDDQKEKHKEREDDYNAPKKLKLSTGTLNDSSAWSPPSSSSASPLSFALYSRPLRKSIIRIASSISNRYLKEKYKTLSSHPKMKEFAAISPDTTNTTDSPSDGQMNTFVSKFLSHLTGDREDLAYHRNEHIRKKKEWKTRDKLTKQNVIIQQQRSRQSIVDNHNSHSSEFLLTDSNYTAGVAETDSNTSAVAPLYTSLNHANIHNFTSHFNTPPPSPSLLPSSSSSSIASTSDKEPLRTVSPRSSPLTIKLPGVSVPVPAARSPSPSPYGTTANLTDILVCPHGGRDSRKGGEDKVFSSVDSGTYKASHMKYHQYGVHLNQSVYNNTKTTTTVPPPALPPSITLRSSSRCYICKSVYFHLHPFYDQLCPECADLNWTKRHSSADLTGKIYILTGCRVKIGFCVGLRLLRAGATVIATSRFPYDTAKRYGVMQDYGEWSGRLYIYGIDLRNIQQIHGFVDSVKRKWKKIDGIIHNAAQTIRRPVQYYRYLLGEEIRGSDIKANRDVDATTGTLTEYDKLLNRQDIRGRVMESLDILSTKKLLVENGEERGVVIEDEIIVQGDNNNNNGMISSSSSSSTVSSSTLLHPNLSALLSQIPLTVSDMSPSSTSSPSSSSRIFPPGQYDEFGQPLDLRSWNSWSLKLDQIESIELVEVFHINVFAPFVLNSRLKSLLMSEDNNNQDKYIINVSSMEGKFTRDKSCTHPHTNMAKAALNMMTRTSAQDYARYRIYMNSVDTGWINEMNPVGQQQQPGGQAFRTPIDEEDAAARILDPILTGMNTGLNSFGKFFKDYKETSW